MELRRIDICLEVSIISMNLVLTLEEHTEQLYHAFEYLNKYHDFELVLDPSDQVIYQADFECQY